MVKYREDQKQLYGVFINLEEEVTKCQERNYDTSLGSQNLLVLRYVRVTQNLNKGSMPAIRCTVGLTNGLEVKVKLHQGSGLVPFLFARRQKANR